MKRFLILCALCLTGCEPADRVKPSPNEYINSWEVTQFKYQGCEYLSTGGNYSQTVTHKGNCSNPIHIYNK